MVARYVRPECGCFRSRSEITAAYAPCHSAGKVKKSKTSLVENPSKDSLPSTWETVHENIVRMRSQIPAAVDTMGCEKCFDTDVDEKVGRFQVLVSLMLSSQTKDQITYATMGELKKRGLSVQFVNDIEIEELQELLKPVGFYRRKAEYLKKTATILLEQYAGDIPRTFKGLTELPGVGPKMAHLTMKVAWNEVTGIAVDTHVHRICNRLKWVKTKTPEQTRVELEKRLPREHWNDINHLLVGFGQSICLPVKPKCSECLNCNICPSSTFSF